QKFTVDDVFNIVLPLHHINSTEFCLAMILVGGTIVLNSRYSASRFWHIVSRFRATNTSIVPTILHDLLTRADEFKKSKLDISSLKRICIGSAPVLPEETIRFSDTFGIRVTQGYGQTETALRVAGVPVNVDKTTYRNLVKTNTIGTELANNHLAIMDENNNEKQEGKEGEICIAGPILADGYLNNPDETAKSFKNGWFHSGDLGYWKHVASSLPAEVAGPGLEPRKFFFIIGRIKEIIIKGGVNLSPSAIEDALLKAFPQVDEVSVVGYPDERMGEEIAAVIVLRDQKRLNPVSLQGLTLENQILDATQNGSIAGLSRYEAPKKVFVFNKLPKTSTGKIQRVEVKKAVAELVKKEHPKHYYVRQIDPHEHDVIKKALEINNARFRFVPSTLKEFIARVQNGLFFGVFEELEGLVGSLSCIRLNFKIVETLTTWNEATMTGTLANNDPNGDTLLCVAISVALKRSNLVKKQGSTLQNNEKELQQLAKQYIEAYVRTENDHVLDFHRKSKGGIPGATVWKILENGRSEDKEAMGYNVLMKYPIIDESTKIVRSNAPSHAILLIEHALLWAKEHGVKNVIAFSRPSGFKKFLSGI
ncbi:long-chain fatty acid--CoA ligase, partial [Candidatus Gottesmanbacteria bacterium]|nr:long-chain fatty acid--CoA ligase [Candidatus Gottesmanbacteria bacterium]